MKFKYGDRVKVKSGFYEGLIGELKNTELTVDMTGEHRKYLVKFVIEKSFTCEIFEKWIPESNLEKLKNE